MYEYLSKSCAGETKGRGAKRGVWKKRKNKNIFNLVISCIVGYGYGWVSLFSFPFLGGRMEGFQ